MVLPYFGSICRQHVMQKPQQTCWKKIASISWWKTTNVPVPVSFEKFIENFFNFPDSINITSKDNVRSKNVAVFSLLQMHVVFLLGVIWHFLPDLPSRSTYWVNSHCLVQRAVLCKRNNWHNCLFAEQMMFDIYDLTADEATPYVNGNKNKHRATF